MSKHLTAKQTEVLAFLREFFAENDQLPPASALRARFGWASDNAASTYLQTLAKKGHIEHNAVGKYRFARRNACESNVVASTTS